MWHGNLNYVERAKIHLARALIVNPEVLILQRQQPHQPSAPAVQGTAAALRTHPPPPRPRGQSYAATPGPRFDPPPRTNEGEVGGGVSDQPLCAARAHRRGDNVGLDREDNYSWLEPCKKVNKNPVPAP